MLARGLEGGVHGQVACLHWGWWQGSCHDGSTWWRRAAHLMAAGRGKGEGQGLGLQCPLQGHAPMT